MPQIGLQPRRSARQAAMPATAHMTASYGPGVSLPNTRSMQAVGAPMAGPARPRHFVAHQLSKRSDPLPPFTAINPGQAKATTYASRMRLGTTSLMQPLGQSGQLAGSAATNATAILGKRQRSTVNYAELETLDDPGTDSDESDAVMGMSRSRTTRRRGLDESKEISEPERRLPGSGRSFLGQQPPPNLITVELAKKTRHSYHPEDRLWKEAARTSLLVPIRIELDTETHRVRDCFVWNARESLISPDAFALVFCEDLGLPSGMYKDRIAQIIREQVEEFSGVAEIDIVPPELAAEHVEADLRAIVNIDVQVGMLHLIDSIEWDLSSPLTPEHFANQLCIDVGISGEAAPIIAHAVHEELLRHKRDAIEAGLVGRIDGEAKDRLVVETQALNLRGPRRMEGVWREWSDASSFGPRVEILTADDLLDREIDKERVTKYASAHLIVAEWDSGLSRRARRDRPTGPGRAGVRNAR